MLTGIETDQSESNFGELRRVNGCLGCGTIDIDWHRNQPIKLNLGELLRQNFKVGAEKGF